ncbi:MAG: GNAT family N-acetyltransferase [Polyangiaceae bacterium]|nr:GNAT family N-acetyltransferase [Polyangiaceae bacterium]MCW5790188.1 GNAT family N-acetyltransferase [Polyangiaceae bacterium]
MLLPRLEVCVSSLTLDDHPAVLEIARGAEVTLDPGSLSAPHALIWVARSTDEAVLGFLLAWELAGELEVVDLVTRASARRRGVARALLGALLGRARARRTPLIALEVRRSNHPAIGLYRSSGFCVIGVRRDYYSAPREDALLMQLHLDPDTGEVRACEDEPELDR